MVCDLFTLKPLICEANFFHPFCNWIKRFFFKFQMSRKSYSVSVYSMNNPINTFFLKSLLKEVKFSLNFIQLKIMKYFLISKLVLKSNLGEKHHLTWFFSTSLQDNFEFSLRKNNSKHWHDTIHFSISQKIYGFKNQTVIFTFYAPHQATTN